MDVTNTQPIQLENDVKESFIPNYKNGDKKTLPTKHLGMSIILCV